MIIKIIHSMLVYFIILFRSVYDHMEQRPGDLDRMEKGQPLAVLRPLDRAWHRAVFLNHDSSGRDLFVVSGTFYTSFICIYANL